MLKYFSGAFVVKGKGAVSVDSKVVHIYLQPSLGDHVCKDMVHKGLEGGWSIVETKKHDGGLIETEWGNKGHFPLIRFLDSNIVVPPADVKFGEVDGILYVIDEFCDERKRIGVPDSMAIEVSIILARTKGSILLWDEEEWCCLGRFGGDDSPSLKMFLDKSFAGILFCRIEGINLGNLQDEGVFEIDSMVKGAMRRELFIGLFRKNVGKILTKFRDRDFLRLFRLSYFRGDG